MLFGRLTELFHQLPVGDIDQRLIGAQSMARVQCVQHAAHPLHALEGWNSFSILRVRKEQYLGRIVRGICAVAVDQRPKVLYDLIFDRRQFERLSAQELSEAFRRVEIGSVPLRDELIHIHNIR